MPNFYSPTKLYPENPVVCRVVPIKCIIAIIQLAAVLMLIGAIYVLRTETLHLISAILALILTIITLAGYMVEQKIIMLVHFWIFAFGSILPIAALGFTFIMLTMALIDDAGEGVAFTYFLGALVILGVYLSYIWMCYKLIKAVQHNTEVLSDFDTTQGLFQFTERDGGNPTESLLYPKL